jgi:hypothetical protein
VTAEEVVSALSVLVALFLSIPLGITQSIIYFSI